jgi:glyoxylase-like metal-dependent hydrolase (beta-lactamase superfamily II)
MSAWRVEPLLEGTTYSSSSTLLENGRHRVVVDTSLSLLEGDLVAALHHRGLEPSDIDIVVNTHLHLDHCLNNAIFPRATVYLSRSEWHWTCAFYAAIFESAAPESAAPAFYPELPSHHLATRTIRNAARMARFFWDPARVGAEERFAWLETTSLPAGLEVVATPGHTPHHISVRVPDAGVLIAGDAVLDQNLHKRVRTMVPFSREESARTRDTLMRAGLRIIPGHGPGFMPERP